ncbi:MAG: TIGR02996 domain-containing protein, partial [Planctomycetales bacterium]
MDQEQRFLAEIADARADAPRLIYADWLEERGDPRADFIRCVVDGVNGGMASAKEIAAAAGIVWQEDGYALSVVESGIPFGLWRSFAVDCAEHVLPSFECNYPSDAQVRETIEIAKTTTDQVVAYNAWASMVTHAEHPAGYAALTAWATLANSSPDTNAAFSADTATRAA